MKNQTTDNATSDATQKVDTKAKETEPIKPEPTDVDTEGINLTDEQWEKVFQSPRFTKLNQTAKEAKKELDAIKEEKEK